MNNQNTYNGFGWIFWQVYECNAIQEYVAVKTYNGVALMTRIWCIIIEVR